jgi:hypothetical protein
VRNRAPDVPHRPTQKQTQKRKQKQTGVLSLARQRTHLKMTAVWGRMMRVCGRPAETAQQQQLHLLLLLAKKWRRKKETKWMRMRVR